MAVQPVFASLVFEKSTVEIPTNPALNEWVADYPFKNTGNKPVTITDIRTCCNCTAAKPDKKTYAVGEAGKIMLNFKTVGKSGYQEKYAVITTDEKTDSYVVFMKGNIPTVMDEIILT
ncbi:MAG: DUF1573 domain-containing protein, partial [Verrucomicrobiota bacterium]